MRVNKKYALITVLLIAYSLAYFHRTMTGVLKEQLDVFASYYNVDKNALISVFFAAYFYAYAFTQPFTGLLLDTYGTRRICSYFLFALSLCTLIMALPSYIGLIVGRTLIGLFASVVFLAAQRSASLLFGKEGQATITGLLLMIGNVSAAIGAYPLLLFIDKYGFNELIYLLTMVTVIVSILVYFLSEDPGGKSKGLGIKGVYHGLGKIVRDKHAWAVALAAASIYSTILAFQSGWGQVYLESLGLSKYSVGLYITYLAILFAVLSPITGYLSDRVVKRRKPFVVTGTILVSLSWLIAYYAGVTNNVKIMPVFLGVLSLAYSMHIPAPSMAKELYSVDYAAVSISFYNIILFSTLAVLLTISPSYISPLVTCTISSVLGVIGFLMSLIYSKETYEG
ncbi:MAG: MFS transporter [Desulfurococcaceae archaeon]